MNGAEESQQKAARLINDLQDISFAEIALIIIGAWAIIFIARLLMPFLAERGPSQFRLYLLGAVPIIRVVVLTVAILWVLPIVFNITVQNFLVFAGAASVAIGFAFKDYVSSLIAGIVAIIERPYRPGDWVKIGDDYGEVRSVGMRAIRICTPDDTIITIPHDRLWSDNIANSNDGAHTLMVVADFYVRADHEPDALREELREVALTSGYLDYDRPVLVIVAQKPFGTHYKLKAYPFDMRDQFQFLSDLTIRGKDAIRDVGAVEIATPVAADAAS